MLAPHLYVDSAAVDAVGSLLEGGLVEGVTTNPTILQRSGRRLGDIPGLYEQWVSQGAREVFFQTWGMDAAELLANAEPIIALGDRVVVKVPATRAGFVATRALTDRGVPVLVTAVYSAGQALAAASYGARYIAPYFGRLGDAGHDAVATIGSMHRMLEGSRTEVLRTTAMTTLKADGIGPEIPRGLPTPSRLMAPCGACAPGAKQSRVPVQAAAARGGWKRCLPVSSP